MPNYFIINEIVYLNSGSLTPVGKKVNKLLELNSDHSEREWEELTEYLKENPKLNGKVDRKVTSFHHSYQVIEGELYRVDHSLEPITGAMDEDPYKQRGYLGSGAYSNVKKITSRLQKSFAMVVEGINEEKYLEFKTSGTHSREGQYLGQQLECEYIRRTFSERLWRKWHETKPPYGKKVIIEKLLPGKTGHDVLKRCVKNELSEIMKLQFALTLLYTFGAIGKEGKLHNDIKLENFMYDPLHCIGAAVDFQFMMYFPIGKEELMCEYPVGTPLYKAPELYMASFGQKACYSKKSEIFSCGIILKHVFENSKEKTIKEYVDNHLIYNLDVYVDIMQRLENRQAILFESVDNANKTKNNRYRFEQAITFFLDELIKHIAPEIEKLSKLIQDEVKVNEKAELLLRKAGCYYFVDYELGIRSCEEVLSLEGCSEQLRQKAWEKIVKFYEHESQRLLFENRAASVEVLNKAVAYIESHQVVSQDMIQSELLRLRSDIHKRTLQNLLEDIKFGLCQRPLKTEDSQRMIVLIDQAIELSTPLEKLRLKDQQLALLTYENSQKLERLAKDYELFAEIYDSYDEKKLSLMCLERASSLTQGYFDKNRLQKICREKEKLAMPEHEQTLVFNLRPERLTL